MQTGANACFPSWLFLPAINVHQEQEQWALQLGAFLPTESNQTFFKIDLASTTLLGRSQQC